jgi:phage-related protein
MDRIPKPLFWIASSRDDLRGFPIDVRKIMGFALAQAQEGGKHADAKPLKGFGGAGVLEIVENHAGNAYRAIYTLKFGQAVYVLHAFQKKSKRGIKTPLEQIELIRRRLQIARFDYERRMKNEEGRMKKEGSSNE